MQDNSLFKKKILQYIDFKDITKATFYRETGITRSTLDKKTGLSEDNVAKFFATYPEVNAEWLLTGKGNMLKTEKDFHITREPQLEYQTPQVVTVDNHQEDNIVLVPEKAQAGYLNGFNNPSFIQKLPSYRLPNVNNGVFRMFQVAGFSMIPTLHNKSIVTGQFVENWQNDIVDNRIYIVVTEEEGVVVKRCLNRIKKYGTIFCKSDNRREYPSYPVQVTDIKEVWEVKLALLYNLPDPTDLYDRMNDLEAEIYNLKQNK
jgi:phage repressor protein C with HTH and peptisase S24 domain